MAEKLQNQFKNRPNALFPDPAAPPPDQNSADHVIPTPSTTLVQVRAASIDTKPEETWLMFNKGALEWPDVYLFLWIRHWAGPDRESTIPVDLMLEASEDIVIPQKDWEKLLYKTIKKFSNSLTPDEESWGLVRKGAYSKQTHFIYLWLLHHANAQGDVFISIESLSQITHFSTSELHNGIMTLNQFRLIQTTSAPKQPLCIRVFKQ